MDTKNRRDQNTGGLIGVGSGGCYGKALGLVAGPAAALAPDGVLNDRHCRFGGIKGVGLSLLADVARFQREGTVHL